MDAKPTLLRQARNVMRALHYSYRTEQQYVHWIRRYVRWSGMRHPRDLGGPELEAFLTHLAVDRTVSASTQNQALAALLFLYQKVLEIELPWLVSGNPIIPTCGNRKIPTHHCEGDSDGSGKPTDDRT